MSDLVSRQEATKQFCNQCKGRNEPCEHRKSCETMKVLKSLPSAEPKHGKWLYKESGHGKCSECGAWVFELYPFCPNCGADMRKGGEDE